MSIAIQTTPAQTESALQNAFTAASRRSSLDLRIVAVAVAAILAGAVLASQANGWRMAALWCVAVGLGLSLYKASFGFSAGYRALLREGVGTQVRAQILLLALLVTLFTPVLAQGLVFGQPVRGFIFPIGAELVAGAFLFGVGMQIAGGCASGTLYTVGGGSVRMLIVLAALVAGATGAAVTYPLWSGGPQWPAVSIAASVGPAAALILQLAFLAGLWAVVRAIERRSGRSRDNLFGVFPSMKGAMSVGWGAIALAALAFATLILSGRPWGLTQAFAVWGSRAVERIGFDDPYFWEFWEVPTRVEALSRPFWFDVFSVMNVGIIFGALLACGLAGRFKPDWRVGFGGFASALIGGLLLGFGGILASGCNIAAFVSGVASGSLHGWVWIAAALPGMMVGIWLRPLFGLDRATGSARQ